MPGTLGSHGIRVENPPTHLPNVALSTLGLGTGPPERASYKLATTSPPGPRHGNAHPLAHCIAGTNAMTSHTKSLVPHNPHCPIATLDGLVQHNLLFTDLRDLERL